MLFVAIDKLIVAYFLSDITGGSGNTVRMIVMLPDC